MTLTTSNGKVVVREAAEVAVRTLITYVGEDPDREGLRDTPRRVAAAWSEMTVGYGVDIAALLAVQFTEPCDELILVTGIEFTSLCEHHVLPFTGIASVGYIPNRSIVGLSKLARLVEAFALRLQVQERMTREIAEAIETHVAPLGVGVVVRARHSCMGCRGIKKPTASMVTSSMLGVLRTNAEARAEFLALDA